MPAAIFTVQSRRSCRSILLLLLVLVISLTAPLFADDAGSTAAPPARALSPGTVLDAEAQFAAQRVTTWTQGDAHHMLLDGDATFKLGGYGFRAERMVVRVDTEATPDRPIRRFSIYLDEARAMPGHSSSGLQSSRLLITAATVGAVNLRTDRLDEAAAAPDDALVTAGHARFARHAARRDAAAVGVALAAQPSPDTADGDEGADGPRRPAGEAAGEPEAAAVQVEPGLDGEPAARAPRVHEPVLPAAGSVLFHADRVVFERREAESLLMLVGNVRLLYQDFTGERSAVLQAERAVVFLSPEAGEAGAGQAVDAGNVSGIYLEDNVVINDGEFTLRAPRMYYDIAADRAVVLDAVLYTWDVQRQVPLYVRAESLRQTSRTSFEAHGAALSTSEFAEPHFAIGANRVTVDLVEDAEGTTRQRFTARHSTLRVGDVPIFYWPYLAGETREAWPLRAISGGHSSRRGFELLTRWDLFALAGQEAPDGIDITGSVDWRGYHGPGIGVRARYDIDGAFGRFDGYTLPLDDGDDRLGDRQRIERDRETRGYVRLQHRQLLPANWYATLEVAYVSDERFLEQFFPSEAYEAKPYQTSLYLLKQEPDWAADFWLTGQLNDFTPQLTTLQSPGYQTERMPELGYFRSGTSLFGDRVTWFSENRFSRVRASFGHDAPSDRGFRGGASRELFGIERTVSFADAADDAGFPRDWRLRVDSRQELTMPVELGPLSITPYAVGRVTGYDDDFERFAGEGDQYRLWGSLGTRLSTQFHRNYDGIENHVFNVNRLRHVIEPSADVFLIGSTVDAGDLPVYDDEVEGIADGSGVRLGLRQTLQTQRGGPGRWRSVDWITLDTDLIFRSRDGDDSHIREPLARYHDYRPEYAAGGDHFYTRLLWMVSDNVGLTGELTYDLLDDHVSHWQLGASLAHTPRLSSFVQYREIEPIASRLLSYGFTYELTTKYTVSFAHRMDLSENESRQVDVWLERRLPRARVRLVATWDQIDDEQFFGIVFMPEGFFEGGLAPGGW